MKYEVKDSWILFDEFIKVEKVRISWELFDGGMGEEHFRYVIRRGDSVGIVPVCGRDKKIVLISQFRYPTARKNNDGYLWEIPAGMVNKDEKPADTALRELAEETGLTTDDIRPLTSFFLSPGLLDEKIHLFLARIGDCSGMREVGGRREEHENIRIRQFTLQETLQMMRSHSIQDGKTVAGLLFYYCFHMKHD
jgi:nudix-type nucleoside diphosphatase (YffH/AdpP family)